MTFGGGAGPWVSQKGVQCWSISWRIWGHVAFVSIFHHLYGFRKFFKREKLWEDVQLADVNLWTVRQSAFLAWKAGRSTLRVLSPRSFKTVYTRRLSPTSLKNYKPMWRVFGSVSFKPSSGWRSLLAITLLLELSIVPSLKRFPKCSQGPSVTVLSYFV